MSKNRLPFVISVTNAADLTIVRLSLTGVLKFVFLTAAKFQTKRGKNFLLIYLLLFVFDIFVSYICGHL